MALLKMGGLAALACCVALLGCNDNKQKDATALGDDHDAVAKQLDTESTRLDELGAQLNREKERNEQLAAQLAACQEGANSAPPPATADASQFAGIPGVEASAVGSDIHLTIASSLLFDSGKTSLKDSSKKSLDQVATKIKELYPTRQILVVGHTDTDPIRKSAYSTNYHLGFERAFRVREYMGKKGLPDGSMALVSYGPDHPHGSKEQSRRVEIVVTGDEASAMAKASKSETPRNASTAASKSTPAKTTAKPVAKSGAKAPKTANAAHTAPSK